MGGAATRAQVRAALDGRCVLDDDKRDRLAADLSEYVVEVGKGHPVGYHDEPIPVES